MVTRPTAVAGSFYPGQRGRLTRELDTLFEQADRPPAQVSPARVKAIVVPHAGYVYSGTTAATGYELLRGRPINRVVVLGPTHRVGIRGMALAGADAFDTPLGPVRLIPTSPPSPSRCRWW